MGLNMNDLALWSFNQRWRSYSYSPPGTCPATTTALYTIACNVGRLNNIKRFTNVNVTLIVCSFNIHQVLIGTRIFRKEKFQMCLSLSFHNYQMFFKVRNSSPLQN